MAFFLNELRFKLLIATHVNYLAEFYKSRVATEHNFCSFLEAERLRRVKFKSEKTDPKKLCETITNLIKIRLPKKSLSESEKSTLEAREICYLRIVTFIQFTLTVKLRCKIHLLFVAY